MISTWCGTPNLSMWSSPAGDRLSTTRKAIWRPAIESIDHGKFPGMPAPAAPSKPLMTAGNRTAKIRMGGTGQIALKKAVPTVAWPVGPILNKNVFRSRPPGVNSHTQEPILEIPPFAR